MTQEEIDKKDPAVIASFLRQSKRKIVAKAKSIRATNTAALSEQYDSADFSKLDSKVLKEASSISRRISNYASQMQRNKTARDRLTNGTEDALQEWWDGIHSEKDN